MAHDHIENEDRNYRRNTISYDSLEETNVSQQIYLEYERNRNSTDESQVALRWGKTVDCLFHSLGKLSNRQREVLILIAVNKLNETKVAQKLGISQSAVSQHYSAAKKKMRKIMGNIYTSS